MQSTKDEVVKAVDALLFASNTLSTFGLKYINTIAYRSGQFSRCIFRPIGCGRSFLCTAYTYTTTLVENGTKSDTDTVGKYLQNNKITTMNMKADLVAGTSTSEGIQKQQV